MAEHIFIPNIPGCYVVVEATTQTVIVSSILVRKDDWTEQEWEDAKERQRKGWAFELMIGLVKIRKVTIAFLPESE